MSMLRDPHIPAVFQSQPSSICWFDLLPCLHPEWSCLEKTQEQSFVWTADWKHVELLMTNIFIPTSFCNGTLCCNSAQRTVWESLRKNVFLIALKASSQYFCPRLPDSSGVCTCIMIYFSHLKPVAKRSFFLEVVMQMGIRAEERFLSWSLFKQGHEAFNLFLITLTISCWHTSFFALTSLWLVAKKLFRMPFQNDSKKRKNKWEIENKRNTRLSQFIRTAMKSCIRFLQNCFYYTFFILENVIFNLLYP